VVSEKELRVRRSIVRLFVVGVVLLASAAPVAAKGMLEASVCGASGCRQVDEMHAATFFERGRTAAAPATAAGWYRVTVAIGDELLPKAERVQDRFTLVVVPDRQMMLGDEGDWTPLSRESTSAYLTMADGVEPFPASTMPGIAKAPSPDTAGSSAPPDGGGPPMWAYAAAGLSLLALTAFVLRRRMTAARA
jgi:hypothetical protein